MGAQQKEGAKLRGGGELLRSPVVPLYLSPIIRFTHRVINKVAIETGFPCIPAIKESDGEGRGTYLRGVIVWYWVLIRGWALISGNTVILMHFRNINCFDQLFVRCHYQWSVTYPLLINQHFITVLGIACVTHIWSRGKEVIKAQVNTKIYLQ